MFSEAEAEVHGADQSVTKLQSLLVLIFWVWESIRSNINMHRRHSCGGQKMLLQMKPSTQWHTSLLWGLSDGKCSCDEYIYILNHTQHNSSFEYQLNLPADSPVLIQSGFAMLAIAKISAARNRHPEMMVSLSISPQAVSERGKKIGGRCPKT